MGILFLIVFIVGAIVLSATCIPRTGIDDYSQHIFWEEYRKELNTLQSLLDVL